MTAPSRVWWVSGLGFGFFFNFLCVFFRAGAPPVQKNDDFCRPLGVDGPILARTRKSILAV